MEDGRRVQDWLKERDIYNVSIPNFVANLDRGHTRALAGSEVAFRMYVLATCIQAMLLPFAIH